MFHVFEQAHTFFNIKYKISQLKKTNLKYILKLIDLSKKLRNIRVLNTK